MTTQSKPKVQSPKVVSAILLAAGRSERMGTFKPLLPFGNTTVVESCIRYLKDAGVSDVIVVLGFRADQLREHLKTSAVRFALNADLTSEMNVSIARGVELLGEQNDGCILIALVDHPAIPPKVVSSLLTEWRRGSPLIIPTWKERGGHPVLVDLRYREELLHLDPNRGLKSLFHANVDQVTRLAVDSPYIAQDIDTWDDYRALHKQVFGYSPPEPG